MSVVAIVIWLAQRMVACRRALGYLVGEKTYPFLVELQLPKSL